MNEFWVDIDGDNESFWEHEWAKHGTCISTLKPSCYTDYTPQEEVPDFFQKTVDIFQTLDSYTVRDPSCYREYYSYYLNRH
jgi:ribonuclease T2